METSRTAPHEAALTVIGRAECLALLGTRPVGRLAFTRQALPDVIPVNYVLHGSTVLIRLQSGSTVARSVRDAVVAFEVDDLDPVARSGWSVTLVGQARAVEPDDALHEALGRFESWLAEPRDLLVAIGTDRITGRRLGRLGRTGGR